MGGLQRNYRLKTTPYYANSLTEVLFHVSTRMNNHNDENKISKVFKFYHLRISLITFSMLYGPVPQKKKYFIYENFPLNRYT